MERTQKANRNLKFKSHISKSNAKHTTISLLALKWQNNYWSSPDISKIVYEDESLSDFNWNLESL